MKKLPDKPSELIRLSLQDLKKCEESKNFEIVMRIWGHYVEKENICYCCLAGAVFYQTLNNDYHICYNYYHDSSSKLSALNSFRLGEIHEGLRFMKISIININMPQEIPIVNYHNNPNKFKEDMLALAYDFEKVGL